jgi:hypothetical protein
MKPTISILDPSFRYVPAGVPSVANTWRRFGWDASGVATSVADTWRRFGWKPPLRRNLVAVQTLQSKPVAYQEQRKVAR